MSRWQRIIKRGFDLCLAVIGLVIFGWLILICWFIASIDTKQNGIYTQERIGKDGRRFKILKIRTMRPIKGITTVVTSRNDRRITRLGSWFRRLKLDELPQLINVLLGDMSFVGPRPDVADFADLLEGEDRVILSIRPGITGPATLAFINEEELLAKSEMPDWYNREVIFPAKVKLNRRYVEEYCFRKDLLYLLATVVPGIRKRVAPVYESVPEE